MVRVTIDAEAVAKPGIDGADRTNHRTPDRGGDQAERAEAALLDEIDEDVCFTNTKPGSRDALTPEGCLTLHARDFQAGPFHGARLRTRGGGVHVRIVPRAKKVRRVG